MLSRPLPVLHSVAVVAVLVLLLAAGPAAASSSSRLVLQHLVKYNGSGTEGCKFPLGSFTSFEGVKVTNFDAVPVNESDKAALDKLYRCVIPDTYHDPSKPFLCGVFNGSFLFLKCDSSSSTCQGGAAVSKIPVKNGTIGFVQAFQTNSFLAKGFCMDVAIKGNVLDISNMEAGWIAGITLAALAGIGLIVGLHFLKRHLDAKEAAAGASGADGGEYKKVEGDDQHQP